MQKFTKEQSSIITGYTGMVACNFYDFHEDVEKRFSSPVFTPEFGDREFLEKVKQMYKDDFVAMCHKGE